MLRPYQLKAVDEVKISLRDGKKAPILVMPTGAGKTVVFCHIAENAVMKGKRVWILVHRVELLRQTSKKLHENGVNHGLINPKYTPNLQLPVQVASVQTLVNRLERYEKPDLIIIDEAHHATAGSWNKIISACPNALIIGVTATPTRADGTGLNQIFDDIIIGPQIYELIEMGFLVKPIVYRPPQKNKIDLSELKMKGSDYDKEQMAEIIDKPSITGDVISHYRQYAHGMAAVVFCVSVAHAEHVAAEFRSAGYKAYSVDGSMEDDLRTRLLGGLEDGTVEIITSCDLISEGTDIPAIGCGIMLRPTQSLSLFIQQAGRILRLSQGKNKAILLDHVGNTVLHGLPQQHRDWTLEGQKRNKKSKNQEPAIRVIQCPACYAMYFPNPEHKCEVCGTLEEISSRELLHVDGQLEEVTEEQKLQIKIDKQREVSKARTLEELLKIEKDRGYKRGWATRMFKLREDRMINNSVKFETPTIFDEVIEETVQEFEVVEVTEIINNDLEIIEKTEIIQELEIVDDELE
jgi:superfamily II DNA or RNA helicase